MFPIDVDVTPSVTWRATAKVRAAVPSLFNLLPGKHNTSDMLLSRGADPLNRQRQRSTPREAEIYCQQSAS